MRRSLNHLLIILIAAITTVAGQTVPPSELDVKYTPNTASPFNRQRNKKGQYEETEVTIRNAIRFCPTMLIRQKLAFFYERKIIDGLSINVGLGKAFGPDFIQNNYFSSYKAEYNPGAYLNPTLILSNSEYYGSGLLFMAGMRIYFSGNALEGGYFEFNYRREEMFYQLMPKIYNYRIDGTTIAGFMMNNFNFGVGISNVTGTRKNITHEFFLLLGVKNFLISNYQLVDNSFITGQQGDFIYRQSATDLTARIIPSINIGYSLGFGF